MARRTADWLLIVVLAGSWAVLFVRAVSDGLRDQRAHLTISVSSAPAADAYPRYLGGLGAGALLAPGDEITAVDGASVRGASALAVYDLAERAGRESSRVTLAGTHAGS